MSSSRFVSPAQKTFRAGEIGNQRQLSSNLPDDALLDIKYRLNCQSNRMRNSVDGVVVRIGSSVASQGGKFEMDFLQRTTARQSGRQLG